MKRLFWLVLAAAAIWILWFGYASKVLHPIRTHDVIDSIKIQIPWR